MRSEHNDFDRRSELAAYLRPSVFPADRSRLVSLAREERAPDGLIHDLESLSEKQFVYFEEVWNELLDRQESAR